MAIPEKSGDWHLGTLTGLGGTQPCLATPTAANIWRARLHGFSEFPGFHFHYTYKIKVVPCYKNSGKYEKIIGKKIADNLILYGTQLLTSLSRIPKPHLSESRSSGQSQGSSGEWGLHPEPHLVAAKH